jgi:hypothetical protein
MDDLEWAELEEDLEEYDTQKDVEELLKNDYDEYDDLGYDDF